MAWQTGKYSQFKTEGEWNLNQVFSEILKEILLEINVAGLRGDIKGRFNALRILYNNIYGHDKTDTATLSHIDDMMSRVARKMKRLPDNLLTTSLSKLQRSYLDSVKRLLDDIHRELLNQMYQAGLLFPISKKDPTYSGMDLK